jgi:hypothetical protein
MFPLPTPRPYGPRLPHHVPNYLVHVAQPTSTAGSRFKFHCQGERISARGGTEAASSTAREGHDHGGEIHVGCFHRTDGRIIYVKPNQTIAEMKYEPNLDEVTRSLASLNVHYGLMGTAFHTTKKRRDGLESGWTANSSYDNTTESALQKPWPQSGRMQYEETNKKDYRRNEIRA